MLHAFRRSKHFAADLATLADFHDGAERCIRAAHSLIEPCLIDATTNLPSTHCSQGVGAPYMPWSVVAAVWASSRVSSETA
jgi:hypothetical protein